MKMKRREFLQKSALAVAGAAVMASGVNTVAKAAEWTSGLKTLNPHEAETLLRMSRQLFPHEQLQDSYYVVVVQDLDTQASTDPATAKLLADGVAKLDRVMDAKFVTLSEHDQIGALRKMEDTEFFNKVRGSEIVSLYNNQAVWKVIGYQGASYQIGGYLHHGFNDLKWLPDPPESASPKPA